MRTTATQRSSSRMASKTSTSGSAKADSSQQTGSKDAEILLALNSSATTLSDILHVLYDMTGSVRATERKFASKVLRRVEYLRKERATMASIKRVLDDVNL